MRLNNVEPGEYTIKIDYGCGIQTRKVVVEKDKVNIQYFAFSK